MYIYIYVTFAQQSRTKIWAFKAKRLQDSKLRAGARTPKKSPGSPSLIANGWQRAAQKLHAAQAMTYLDRTSKRLVFVSCCLMLWDPSGFSFIRSTGLQETSQNACTRKHKKAPCYSNQQSPDREDHSVFSVRRTKSRKTASISSGNIHGSKLRKKIEFLRAESADIGGAVASCHCLDRVSQVTNRCGDMIHQFASWIRDLDEPKRISCLARFIHHKAFEAAVMIAVLANTVYIAYETSYEMQKLGKMMEVGQLVELMFLAFFTFEIGVRLWVHGLYFFVNEDWSWNLMDAILMFLAYLDQILEYANASVGKVGMLRLLRVTRLFRIIRVLRFLREVRVMLVAIVGSFISLFWALSMLAVIIFMFAIYFMQQMTTYLSSKASNPDELWQLQWDYFNNLGSSMYVLLMASTGGKDWEEVSLRQQDHLVSA